VLNAAQAMLIELTAKTESAEISEELLDAVN
jgi:hypothetical protein